MKKLLPSALLALLLAYSPMAFCENWECADGELGFSFCLDTESIKDEGLYRTAQIKMTVPEGMPMEGKDVSYLKFTVSFDCENKTATSLSADLYGKDGKIMEGESKANPNPVYESTQNDDTSKFFDSRVCGKK